MPRGPITARVLVALVVLLGAAVLAAAITGPWVYTPKIEIFVGPGGSTSTPIPSMTIPPGEVSQNRYDWLLALLPWLVAAVAVVVALLLMFTSARRRVLERQRHAAAERARLAGAVAGQAVGVDEVAAAVEAARRELARQTDPADAVIAAWVALEAVGARSGAPRHAADSPTEFSSTLAERADIDPQALAELLDLYHRARFSTHPVTDADVRRAGACLDRIVPGSDRAGSRPELTMSPD